MSSPGLDAFAAINANACFFIGVALNGTLVWLILHHTPNALTTYSRVLTQIAVVNILSVATTVFFGSVQVNGSTGSICYGVGWLTRPNARTWNLALSSAWFFMVMYGQFSMPVPFLYRYFILCRQVMMPGWVYCTLLALVAIPSGIISPGFGLLEGLGTAVAPTGLLAELNISLDGNDTSGRGPVALAIVNLPSSGLQTVHANTSNTLSAIAYLIVVGCSVAIFIHLRRAGANISGSEQQRRSWGRQAWQINAILVIQAVVPLLFDFLPNYLNTLLLYVVGGESSPQSPTFTQAWIVWAPVVSAVSTILVVRPYRRAVLSKLLCTSQDGSGDEGGLAGQRGINATTIATVSGPIAPSSGINSNGNSPTIAGGGAQRSPMIMVG